MAAIYVHVPFCRQRCSYCDFYFVTSHREIDGFVSAVVSEMRLRLAYMGALEPVETIYFGGGTPSRLQQDQLRLVLNAVLEYFDVSRSAEITMEVNPDDVTDETLSAFRSLGVTRLSLGVQSLHGPDLRFMNRSHDEAQARSSVSLARSAGFESVSMDLIFGLPDMSDDDWRTNLQYAISSGAQHVSLYGLTVEPKTVLGKWVRSGKVIPAPEERMEAQFRIAHEMMTECGFDHYEISNFALQGHRSRHNSSYWNHTNYLGFGPSAHSFWKFDTPNRWENPRSLNQYLASISSGRLPSDAPEVLNSERLMQEFVLLGLRTSDGIDLTRLKTEYGYIVTETGDALISSLSDSGKLIRDETAVRLTLDGFLVADAITGMLLDGRSFEESQRSSGR